MTKTRSREVSLRCEALEDRCTPAFLSYQAQEATIANVETDGIAQGFQLAAKIQTVSDPFFAPDGSRREVRSLPVTFEAILTESDAEWLRLLASYGPGTGYHWENSNRLLAANSLIIRDAEALDPGKVRGGLPSSVGQSLIVKYNATGIDPDPSTIHWLQFVTTTTRPFATGANRPGSIGIDNLGRNTPFYDLAGGAADDLGFADVAFRPNQNELIRWEANLFLVQDVPRGNATTRKIQRCQDPLMLTGEGRRIEFEHGKTEASRSWRLRLSRAQSEQREGADLSQGRRLRSVFADRGAGARTRAWDAAPFLLFDAEPLASRALAAGGRGAFRFRALADLDAYAAVARTLS